MTGAAPLELEAQQFLERAASAELVDEKLRELAAGAFGMEPTSISMWLRLTYGRRSELQSWWALLYRCVEVCRSRGIEPTHVLGGLTPGCDIINRNTGAPSHEASRRRYL